MVKRNTTGWTKPSCWYCALDFRRICAGRQRGLGIWTECEACEAARLVQEEVEAEVEERRRRVVASERHWEALARSEGIPFQPGQPYPDVPEEARPNPGPDDRLREAERRARRTMLPEDAIRLYLEQNHVLGPREHASTPFHRLEIPRIGPVLLGPQAEAVRIMSPGPGHDPETVRVNRVDFRVDGSYFFYPDHGWIPVRSDRLGEFERTAAGAHPFDPTRVWMNSISLRRVGLTRSSEASDSAFRRFMTVFNPLLQAWIQEHPAEMREGEFIAANNEIWRTQDEALELRAKLAELDDKIAQAILTQLRAT